MCGIAVPYPLEIVPHHSIGAVAFEQMYGVLNCVFGTLGAVAIVLNEAVVHSPPLATPLGDLGSGFGLATFSYLG